MDDLRNFARFEASFPVVLKAPGDEPRRIEAHMVDISSSGIAVAVRQRLTVGEELTVEVQDTGVVSGPLVLGEGRVVYTRFTVAGSVRPRKAGIQFTAPNAEHIQQLLQLLQQRRLVESRRRKRAKKQRQKKPGKWF